MYCWMSQKISWSCWKEDKFSQGILCNMKMIAYLLVVAVVARAEKLQGNYLPPSGAQSAAGSGSFLSAPRQTFSGFSGSSASAFPQPGNYLPPATGGLGIGGGSGGFSSDPKQRFSGLVRGSGSAFTQSDIATSYAAPASGPVPAGLYSSPTRTYSSGVPVGIVRFDNQNNGDGTYRFEYQTENKITQQEQGQVQNGGTDQASSVVHGSYSYEAPNGETITVAYVADENGFRASGDHIPTPPPIPATIQKSLEISALGSSASGYSSSSFSGGVSSSSSFGGSVQPPVARQYLAPGTQTSGGYRY